MHKLTMMQVAKIIMSDKSNRQLAKEFGVSISTISKIRRGESWKCIYYIYIYWDD
ncbi:MAG: helix-turn-helix domain-containing protein [Clostridiales bacterium]|nr:helix-turn-helix domain-containing protein [Clostridiales bacterium]